MDYNITSAQYYNVEGIDDSQIKVRLDGSNLWTFFPNVVGNDLYDAVMKEVSDGNLTIADAD
jgi:hypothetical protein